tara:strand:- start:402 stop:773 length:372 start_codon:yes stop_codon:yes gene_type:complete
MGKKIGAILFIVSPARTYLLSADGSNTALLVGTKEIPLFHHCAHLGAYFTQIAPFERAIGVPVVHFGNGGLRGDVACLGEGGCLFFCNGYALASKYVQFPGRRIDQANHCLPARGRFERGVAW